MYLRILLLTIVMMSASSVALAQDKEKQQQSIIDELLNLNTPNIPKKKPEPKQIDICNMSLHKRLVIYRNIEVMRVYGGWIYYRHNMGSQFVPEGAICQFKTTKQESK